MQGKPTKPKGPLDITDIFEDRATLHWKPPEDDGGVPITHVIFVFTCFNRSQL